MPPKSPQQQANPDVANFPHSKTIKRCECGATVFQGPFHRGSFVNGEWQERETLYQCVNCNRVAPIEKFEDYEVPVLN